MVWSQWGHVGFVLSYEMTANDGTVNVWDWLLDYLKIMVNGIHGCCGFAVLVIFLGERLDLLQLDQLLG